MKSKNEIERARRRAARLIKRRGKTRARFSQRRGLNG